MILRGCLARGVPAGWRAAIFLALLVVLLVVLVAAFGREVPRPGGAYTPGFLAANELFLLLPVLGATRVMGFLEATPWTAYGLAGKRKMARLGGGLASGGGLLGLLAVVLLLAGYGVAGGGRFGLLGDLRYGAEWLAVSLLIGVTEEMMFRGYLLATLARGIGFWPAALLTSAAFGLMHGHNAGENFIGLFQVAGAGMLLCLGIRFTGSLWWAIGFHAGWDYAENFIFGTPDSGVRCFGTLMQFAPRGNVVFSGGQTGPEGSVFGLAALVLAGVVLWLGFSGRREKQETSFYEQKEAKKL
jgi:membrane protease YdiL (CAAX protease family)